MPNPAGPVTAPSSLVTIDMWADLGCPWCYVGTRRLALAVAREQVGSVLMRWRAHPAALREGHDPEPTGERLVVAGREVGIRFDLDRVGLLADTELAQRAVLLYDREPRQRAVVAALFGAYFEAGLDLGDLAVVADVAGQAAAEPAPHVRRRLEAGEGADRLAADADEAATVGILAVPTYVVGGLVAVRGDQQPATLRAIIAEARRLGAGPQGQPGGAAGR